MKTLPSTIGWWIDPKLALVGLSRRDIVDALTAAVCNWQPLLKLRFQRVLDRSAALVRFSLARMAKKTWADSDCYPLTDSRPRLVRFDRASVWTPALLLAVAGHELGHALGLDHGPGLMAPLADPLVYAPQAADRWRLWALYPQLANAPGTT